MIFKRGNLAIENVKKFYEAVSQNEVMMRNFAELFR